MPASNQSVQKVGVFGRSVQWMNNHPKTMMGIGPGASALMVAKDITEVADAKDGKDRAVSGTMLGLDVGLGALDAYAMFKAFRKV